MIIYFVLVTDTHKPFKSVELTTYPVIPRVAEHVLIDEKAYEVVTVMHNIDLSEIKIVVKR
jgi:hypothetical protein